ncbi:ABA4-like family protein [Streptomyces sp. NPDC048305]|uniref:ABA4-like family protein n=1 Tax=Streptomyces sp. NPDC048305 TaxID=3365532 RepID=UPI00371ED4EC
MTGALFEVTFLAAAPFWLLMVFAPGWRLTQRVAASPLTVLPVLTLWAVMAAPVLPELWAAVSSPDIDTFRELTALANGAGAVWAQIIAWDLLIGQWIFLRSRRLGLSPLVSGPLLVLTVLLSPVGWAVFLVIRMAVGSRLRPRPSSPDPRGPGAR